MDITQILKEAEKGNLECCMKCPWSPVREESVGFGVSCTTHGMNWKKETKANSMIVVQDPGDTTPHHTGRLCAVHNAENPTDKTAQQNLQLWNAAVSLEHNNPEAGGYLKHHYWTNAIMHGASGSTGLREKSIMKAAQKCCSNVLAFQIQALKPNIVIAKGTTAVNSLHEIGIIRNDWSVIRHNFGKGAYREDVTSWGSLPPFKVFCTYHTSARVVNQTLSRLYNSTETEKYIREKLEKLNSQESIKQFLMAHIDTDNNSRARGMRYLLNHWLDIGAEMRVSSNEKT